MTQIGLPKPDKQYKWDKWRAYVYNGTQRVILIRQDGKTLIIKPSTDVIVNVPKYVQRKLNRIGFLTKWREEQLKKSVTRLKDLANKHERFLKRMERHKLA